MYNSSVSEKVFKEFRRYDTKGSAETTSQGPFSDFAHASRERSLIPVTLAEINDRRDLGGSHETRL